MSEPARREPLARTSREQDCEQVETLLDAFLAGTLPPADGARLRAHLEACQDCQTELRALRLGRRARDLLVPEPGYERELVRRRAEVLERLGRSDQPMVRILHLFGWRWAAAAVAAALIAAGIVAWLRVSVPSTPLQPERSVVQVPRGQTADVTRVTFVHDDVQIVWVFDPHFEP